MKDDKLRDEINDIIEADIQIALNDYIEKEGGNDASKESKRRL